MTSSTPPGQYDDSAPDSAFVLENGQMLGGEDVFTPGTVGVQPAVLRFSDKSHLVLNDERPPVS